MPPTNRSISYDRKRVDVVPLYGRHTENSDDFIYEVTYTDPAIADFLDSTDLLKALTKRQRPVAKLLAQGYTRAEVAEKRGVCLQAIHQMVPVMRRRITRHLEKQRAI